MRKTVAVIVSGMLMAGCTSGRHPSLPPGSTTSTLSGAPTTTTGSTTVPSATSTTVPAVQNLVATADVKAGLLAAYAAAKSLPQSDFVGPTAGSTYYAYLPSTHTYWALAQFLPAPGVGQQVQIGMQDGGDRGVFTRADGGAWHVALAGIPFPCPGRLPSELMAVWRLTSPGSCIVSQGESPARASVPAGGEVMTIPDGTYFGTILYFDLQLDGYGTLIFEPETWQGSTPPVSHNQETTTLEINQATTTEYWTGANPAAGHAVDGRFDVAFASVVKQALVPFTTQPYSGYQITVANPAGCQGACSTATRVVQIGPGTPRPAHPDFSEPPAG